MGATSGSGKIAEAAGKATHPGRDVPRDACERWKRNSMVLKGPFLKQARDGYAYVAALKQYSALGDDNEKTTHSPALLCENGRMIGKPHSLHEDIRRAGRGLFSHWADAFVFSASDNSDPNTNGREYRVILPPGTH